MNDYSELQQAILDDTHRPDLSGHVTRFIREGEALIRRKLKGYLLTTTLTDADGTATAGVYNLPLYLLEVRDIKLQGRQGDSLVQVAPGQIRRLATTADVLQYCVYGARTVEFRGHPSTDHVFDLVYYGMPDPLSDAEDKNDLLTDHEDIYMTASKFYLYNHTQDRELAKDEYDLCMSYIDDLNEQVARRIGGATIAPSYNFSGGSSY